MKHIIILGDGMADHSYEELGNKTLLQYAHTPYMDLLAFKGRCGLLQTVAEGFHPGSEVANMSVLGYDVRKVYEGRGVLEAASMGVELDRGDMAMRCNLVCIEGDRIKNHSAGHISNEEAYELVDFLSKNLGSDAVKFHTGVSYRHLLVISGGDKRIDCTPPHDVPMREFRPLMVKPLVQEARGTAELVNSLILRSQELLKNHPVNLKRIAEGKDPANSIWPWSPGYRPDMAPLCDRFPTISSGAVISAVDLIKGIGRYAGLKNIDVEGATGLYDTNYANKVAAALAALEAEDFVYLHIEASDEAGHEGNIELKIRTIEDLDAKVVGPIYEALKEAKEKVSIAVLPDHPTPCRLRTHTDEPVPFIIYNPDAKPDGVTSFDEESVKKGYFKLLKNDQFIKNFLQ